MNEGNPSFWWARAGTTEMRILEGCCACYIYITKSQDQGLIELYKKIRKDEFKSLDDIANHEKAKMYLYALVDAFDHLDGLPERDGLDEETLFHAHGVIENLSELINDTSSNDE